MKVLAGVLLLSLALATTVIVVSDISTTTVTSPADKEIGYAPHYRTHRTNIIGQGSQWVWLEGGNK